MAAAGVFFSLSFAQRSPSRLLLFFELQDDQRLFVLVMLISLTTISDTFHGVDSKNNNVS